MNTITQTPNNIAKILSDNVRACRKKRNLSMARLSELSGVSFGSIRRFEKTGEISLKSLIKLAIVLDCADEFTKLFSQIQPSSIQEIINGNI